MADSLYALPVDPDIPPVPAEVVNALDVGALPTGLSRLFVELVGDGLATGIRVPALAVRGTESGPIVGVTAGIHGNELNGIPVIHEVLRSLDPTQMRGTVVGVIAVNVPGLHLHQRELPHGTDLNRIMPGSPTGNVAQVYAHRVLDRIIKQFDVLIDLHTASFGRVNSLYVRADMTVPKAAAMAYLQRPQIIVHNRAADTTLRGAAMAMGIPAITVEIGDPQRWQEKFTHKTAHGLRDVLDYLGVIEGHRQDLAGTPEPVLCKASSWMFTDRGGLLDVFPGLCDRVEQGQRVALVRNAFGDTIREYGASRAGIVVGKSTNPVGQTGARIVHLGVIACDEDGLISRRDCGA